MPYENLTVERKTAFSNLLDDPNPFVRSQLLKEFIRLGATGRSFLEELINGENRIIGGHAHRILEELRNANPNEEFKAFIQSLNYELETGMIHICRVAYPDLAPELICTHLDAIADRCRELLIKPSSPRERCVIINRVLFHELGFRGNSDDYGNPENSFLNRVFETKKGLPLTLSAIYILVGQRIGADLDPISYPGHFLVGSFEDDLPFYIDPFHRGRFITPNQLLDKSGGFVPLSEITYLTPSPIREVLIRCCRNVTNHFANKGEDTLAQLFLSFVQEFDKAYQKNPSR